MNIVTRGLGFPHTRQMAVRVLEPERESHFLGRVVQLARAYGFQSELIYHTHRSDHSQAGFPDLVLVRPPRVIFAELKTERAPRLLPLAQEVWKDALERCPGVEYYLWRPRDFPSIERILKRR